MEPVTPKKRNRVFPTLFGLTLFLVAYWVIGLSTNASGSDALGGIFAILWLPAVLLSVLVPLICFILWLTEKFSLKSKYLYLMLASIAIVYFVATLDAS
ncbi:MAG: hypothetical protein EOO48_13610 [Flavobacterium sp.]|nr:MAG: hypothetical protein EOO48_13610 [Flavobacterium sp.]